MTIVTEVLPRSLDAVDLAAPESRDWLRARYRRTGPASVRLNMVTTPSGAAAGADGTSETLTGGADRTILGVLRREADAVLVGARTVRAERYVLPRATRLAVLTRTGDLTGHRFDPARTPEQLLIVCPETAAGRVAERNGALGATIVAVPGAAAPADVVAALAARGLRHLVCEGGPDIASTFAQAGLIDEYCLTVAPALVDADAPFLGKGSEVVPAGLLVDDAGFSYLRLRPRGAAHDARATT